MFIIKLILMATGVCVWFVISAGAIGFISAAIGNKIYQRKRRIYADKLARERIDDWLSRS